MSFATVHWLLLHFTLKINIFLEEFDDIFLGLSGLDSLVDVTFFLDMMSFCGRVTKGDRQHVELGCRYCGRGIRRSINEYLSKNHRLAYPSSSARSRSLFVKPEVTVKVMRCRP